MLTPLKSPNKRDLLEKEVVSATCYTQELLNFWQ